VQQKMIKLYTDFQNTNICYAGFFTFPVNANHASSEKNMSSGSRCVMNECNECKLPKIVKIRYISYTLNLFKTIAVASPTRAVTVNSLEFSKYLQFVTFALVLSTRQCRYSSLYYQECNELLIIFYIIDVTSHTLSLSARHTRRSS